MRRGAYARPAVDDQSKNGREFEGGALIGGEADVSLSCFISKRVIVTEANGVETGSDRATVLAALERNRKISAKTDKPGRKRGCGAWTVEGTSSNGRQHRFIRLNCKCWGCGYCGPRKLKRYRRAIQLWSARLNLNRFLTLTLDPKKLQGAESTKYINETFAKLRSVLHRKHKKQRLSYIRVLQYQKNGMAHFHLLVDRFIDVDWLREQWQALGGGWNVWITRGKIRNFAAYISGYLTQSLTAPAPKGARRVTASRNVHLFEKPPKDFEWKLHKTAIERLRFHFLAVLNEIFCEVDGSLTTFMVERPVA
jgi:hypothetical protein